MLICNYLFHLADILLCWIWPVLRWITPEHRCHSGRQDLLFYSNETLRSITAQGYLFCCSLFSKEVCNVLHTSLSLNDFSQYAASIHVLPWKRKSSRDETWSGTRRSEFCLLMNILWSSHYSQWMDRRKPDVSFKVWGVAHRSREDLGSWDAYSWSSFCSSVIYGQSSHGRVRVLLVSISCHGLDVVDRQNSGFCWWETGSCRIWCIRIRFHVRLIAWFISCPQDCTCCVCFCSPRCHVTTSSHPETRIEWRTPFIDNQPCYLIYAYGGKRLITIR